MKIESIKCKHCGMELVPKFNLIHVHQAGQLMLEHDQVYHTQNYEIKFNDNTTKEVKRD